MDFKKELHALFEAEDYRAIYEKEPDVVKEMLLLAEPGEPEDFLESGEPLEEASFWLYYQAVHWESLLIGSYEGDVTERVTACK